ncbi:MAG: LysM peptidoglycan-binding domain-containing protein [Acidimicrobiia bacterium]
MTAVMATIERAHRRPARPATRPCHTPTVARCAEPSSATYRRRRVVAAAFALALLAVAGKAGAALEGPSLAGPPRHPSVVTYVVQPGDSLWSIAQRLAPGRDPRPIVDELEQVRRGATLQPGETIIWQR